MNKNHTPPLAVDVARRFGALPEVEAVAIAGSIGTGHADQHSDLDLYVYSPTPPSLADRAEIAGAFADWPEIGNMAFGPGDEWRDRVSGRAVDIMYWSPDWIEERLDAVLVKHRPAAGYTTCFWAIILNSRMLVDRSGWFNRLQQSAQAPYPEPLRQAIVDLNLPLLAQAMSSFRNQVEKAMSREDGVAVQHRTAGFLASFFDILFAINRIPHPGEKRLSDVAIAECSAIPADCADLVNGIVAASAQPWEQGHLLALLDHAAGAMSDPVTTWRTR